MGENYREEWDRLEVLFEEALTLPPEHRDAFLEDVYTSDPVLHDELKSLLSSYDEASAYFDSLAEDVLPSVMRDLSQPSSASSRIGQTIGSYHIVEAVGGGGMGIVYKARDLRLDRFVALKFLPLLLSPHPEAKRRFVREAQAASALDHPNICTIYEIGEADDGQLFIAMAYYEGETLKEKIARGPLPVKEAIDYATQIVSGLERARQAGIVHRDVKPANVLITEEGVAKIVDFGLAKTADIGLTKTGVTMGTVAYMSPEQARGETVDHRTDLWSLGVVLYEMIAGRRPFSGENEQSILYAIQHRDPTPLLDRRNDVSSDVQEIVARCLEKNPNARYSTATELETELQRVQQGRKTEHAVSSRKRPTAPRLSTWARRTAFGVAGLVIIGLVLWLFPPTRAPLGEQLGLTSLAENIQLGAVLQAERGMVVLPCTNAEQDPSTQALCTGLMATLTDQFLQLQRPLGIWVVPAEEIRYRGAATPPEARQWYDADLVLTGTTRRDEEQIHVDLTLLDGSTLQPVATDGISLPAANATVLQKEATARVAGMLGVELQSEQLGSPTITGTVDPHAYEAYLQGYGYLWQYEEPENLDAAVTAFQQAVKGDSVYAPAHAGLCEGYWRRYEATQATQWVATASRHCERALALNDRLVAAYKNQGLIFRGTGQYEEAERAFQRARSLHPERADLYRDLASVYVAQGKTEEAESIYNTVVYRWPNYWLGYNDLGRFYMSEGHFEAAVTQFRQAVAAAPDHFRTLNNLAALYQYMGRRDEARERYEHLLDIKPNFGAYSNLGSIYFDEGRYADAAEMYEEALSLEKDNYLLWGNLAAAHYWAGARETAQSYYQKAAQMAEAERKTHPQAPMLLSHLAGYYAMLDEPDRALPRIEQALALAPDDVQVAFSAATIYEQLGKRELALQWIETAVEHGYPQTQIENDPVLRRLHSDPRFQKILQRSDSLS